MAIGKDPFEVHSTQVSLPPPAHDHALRYVSVPLCPPFISLFQAWHNINVSYLPFILLLSLSTMPEYIHYSRPMCMRKKPFGCPPMLDI